MGLHTGVVVKDDQVLLKWGQTGGLISYCVFWVLPNCAVGWPSRRGSVYSVRQLKSCQHAITTAITKALPLSLSLGPLTLLRDSRVLSSSFPPTHLSQELEDKILLGPSTPSKSMYLHDAFKPTTSFLKMTKSGAISVAIQALLSVADTLLLWRDVLKYIRLT